MLLSCAKLAKLRTNHCLMGILFVMLRCTVVLILVLELVMQYPGPLMVGYSFQHFALVAFTDDLVNLFGHLLVLLEEVWVEVVGVRRKGSNPIVIATVCPHMRLAIRAEHLPVFFLKKRNGRVQHHEGKQFVLGRVARLLGGRVLCLVLRAAGPVRERRLLVHCLVELVRVDFLQVLPELLSVHGSACTLVALMKISLSDTDAAWRGSSQ